MEMLYYDPKRMGKWVPHPLYAGNNAYCYKTANSACDFFRFQKNSIWKPVCFHSSCVVETQVGVSVSATMWSDSVLTK